MIADAIPATEIVSLVRRGKASAAEIVRDVLVRIRQVDPGLNCFTAITADRALAEAETIDRARAQGRPLGPLAGVPYGVKNLFDVQGLPTLAGSKINASRALALRDATLISRLKAAGAVLVGTLNMDEYAYGFTTENTHYGPTRNPHDPTRVTGGSSGGSAAAVAAGLVPVSLGSDTNGSIRVPASLCGVFALKPTYGRLSRAGAYPFAASLDHVGPFARTVADLALAYDALQGLDAADPVCARHPAEPVGATLETATTGLRIAVARGHFGAGGEPAVFEALAAVAVALGATREVEIAESARARAAAAIITAAEGGNLHLSDLRKRAGDFDPRTRDRFLAGALVPAAWYVQAQRFRAWYRARALELFRDLDAILAPATPAVAPRIGQETLVIDGVEVLARPHLGIYTQPISFIGLPALVAPVRRAEPLPIGVQIIAGPWQEALCFRLAARLEAAGVVG